VLHICQKIQKSSDRTPPVRLPTGPRAGPWITLEGLTGRRQSEKVTHVLHHAHWTDMV